MNIGLKEDAWKIIEEGWNPAHQTSAESIFSIGNGRMGQRANFEEHYSGDTFSGNYVAGVYYPDKTRVGWWKNGYPEYFAKVLNAANWMGARFFINGAELDLHYCQVDEFRRELDMKEGVLRRSFVATLPSGNQVKVESERFLSIVDDECGALSYTITPLNFEAEIKALPFVDFDVINEDSNYHEKFWDEVETDLQPNQIYLVAKTKKLDFHVCSAMRWQVYVDGKKLKPDAKVVSREKYAANEFSLSVSKGSSFTLIKFGCNLSSENYPVDQLIQWARERLSSVREKGYEQLLSEQKAAWAEKWDEADIVIHGDIKAQQAIRFNIFQLYQTYTGKDARLNIGPKGFTGEKYGGSTYWDTEAYCLPFYLSTADQQVARQLLIYRHKQLDKAIENAAKLGFKDGAALYPMVTMNGEECHNEWEITFEEIHRNGAIAFAIKRYIDYTGDHDYLAQYGLEVLIGIARFWSQRVHWSSHKQQYVMLGVTGPNEYENNINNNWYTNYIASWCMQYTLEGVKQLEKDAPAQLQKIQNKTHFKSKELEDWKHRIDHMYYPVDKERNVFLQQDGFLDKELLSVDELSEEERPINQHWSWDRILRSCFIKQADVLQGMYFFESDFDLDTIRRNYLFYEPMTVHESSLSPCVHAIIAAKIGEIDAAYSFYLRTSRLDLDDYNKEVHEGLHITSMAGTWMSVVEGFGGMRIKNGQLHFSPSIPSEWKGFEFKIRFRSNVINVACTASDIQLTNLEGEDISIGLGNTTITVSSGTTHTSSFHENVLQ